MLDAECPERPTSGPNCVKERFERFQHSENCEDGVRNPKLPFEQRALSQSSWESFDASTGGTYKSTESVYKTL